MLASLLRTMLTHAIPHLRFYIDDSGATQGPYASEALRGWLLAGYFRSSTRVASSLHGEVPVQDEFQPVSVLWSDPQSQVEDDGASIRNALLLTRLGAIQAAQIQSRA
jgi:hypothetical protein